MAKGSLLVAALFGLLAVGYVVAIPGLVRDESSSAESTESLAEKSGRPAGRPVSLADFFEDDDMDFPMTPFRSPNNIFQQMQEMMKQMREQMAAALAGQLAAAGKMPFEIPEGANTTSDTKVINGHLVTVNETTYSKNTDHGEAVYHFKIVDVKPLNETKIETDDKAEAVDQANPDSEDKIQENQGASPAVKPNEAAVPNRTEDAEDNEIDIVKA